MKYAIAYTFSALTITQFKGAGGGIRTHGFLRNRVLSAGSAVGGCNTQRSLKIEKYM